MCVFIVSVADYIITMILMCNTMEINFIFRRIKCLSRLKTMKGDKTIQNTPNNTHIKHELCAANVVYKHIFIPFSICQIRLINKSNEYKGFYLLMNNKMCVGVYAYVNYNLHIYSPHKIFKNPILRAIKNCLLNLIIQTFSILASIRANC